jgi:hypothetical protein
MNTNGISTASDYLSAREVDLKLPSGQVFRVRAPGLKFQFSSPMPENLDGKPDAEKSQALADFYYRMLCECCVEPRVSMEPQEGELHPDRIRLADAQYITRWAGGEIGSDGADLAKFPRGEAGRSAGDGAGGGDVRPVAERPAEGGADVAPLQPGGGDGLVEAARGSGESRK